MDSGSRGMNSVAMTIINPWPSRGSNPRPPVLKSCTLLTELWGSEEDMEHQDYYEILSTMDLLYHIKHQGDQQILDINKLIKY